MSSLFQFKEQPLADHFMIISSVPSTILPTSRLEHQTQAVKVAIMEAIDNARISPDGSVACRISFDPCYLSVVPVLQMMTPTNVIRMSNRVERGEILLAAIHMTKTNGYLPLKIPKISDAIREVGRADQAIIRALSAGVLRKKPDAIIEALDSLYSCALEQMAAYQNRFATPEVALEPQIEGLPLPAKLPRSNDLGIF